MGRRIPIFFQSQGIWLWLSKPFWDPILGAGEFTTHFRTYLSGDWDVHWGYWLLTGGHISSRKQLGHVQGLA